jgi:hypothetical protein
MSDERPSVALIEINRILGQQGTTDISQLPLPQLGVIYAVAEKDAEKRGIDLNEELRRLGIDAIVNQAYQNGKDSAPFWEGYKEEQEKQRLSKPNNILHGKVDGVPQTRIRNIRALNRFHNEGE